MTLTIIPLIAVFLINVAVIGYVVRTGARTASGFFLVLNALSLVFWAGGGALVRAINETTPEALSLPYFAALLVPANFLYYAMTRPRPLRESWRGRVVLIAVFLPSVALSFLQTYSQELVVLFDYSYQVDDLLLRNSFARAALVYTIAWLAGALALFSIRYQNSTGPEQVIAKHLIVCIIGPLFFGAVFWAASVGSVRIPSPSLLLAMMAQASLIAVLRQEDMRNPRFLSRVVYTTTAVLVAFLLVTIMTEFYTFQVGSFVAYSTVGWMVLVASLLMVLAVRFSRVEAVLDQLLFARAAEYRRLMEETQTELREARERLRRSERLSVVGELAARVAHEIKNPLGPIKGYTQIMREKLEADPTLPHRDAFLRHLAVIAEETENIDRRVHQFLDSARGPQLLLEPVDVNRIVTRCGRLLKLETSAAVEPLSGQSVLIDTECAPGLQPISADQGRVEEAIYNLARNALEAVEGRAGAEVHLRTAPRRAGNTDGVVIEILDTGPGFGTDDVEQFFEAFYTQKSKGTGLGLAIVRSAIEAHGGHVVLGTRPEGGGRAEIWLPVVPVPNVAALLPRA